MIHLRLTDDGLPALRRLRRNITRHGLRVQNALQGKRGRLANKALTAITTKPGPAVKPIEWSSARQRRAFFATRGFGKGIPTKRTNELLDAWKVTFTKDGEGGIVALENPTSYMRFVQGDQVQQFHLNTGYVQVEDVVDDFLKEAEDTVVETFFDVDILEGV